MIITIIKYVEKDRLKNSMYKIKKQLKCCHQSLSIKCKSKAGKSLALITAMGL